MKGGLFRDAVLVVAPCAAILAGLASIDHHQRLVEAGYRVGALERERTVLARDVEHGRAEVASLASPVRLLAEARTRNLGLDYPLAWNRVEGDPEARDLLADRARPAPVRPSSGKKVAAAPRPASTRSSTRTVASAAPKKTRKGGR